MNKSDFDIIVKFCGDFVVNYEVQKGSVRDSFSINKQWFGPFINKSPESLHKEYRKKLKLSKRRILALRNEL